jgi:anti-sigma regulatory factor (Ser/Thr protein kinase)
VGTVNWPLAAPAPEDMRWIRVEDPSAAAACRAAGVALATRLRFPAARAAELALAVTEAATNLHKHAREGMLMLRISRADGKPGIELVTIDGGPGVAATSAALRDGHSTSGSLGIGLGAIARLADYSDLWSVPGHGTVLAARFWPEPGRTASGTRGITVPYAGLIRPMSGETECGDNFGAIGTSRQGQDGLTLTGVLCDGLGHGPLAAIAATAAISAVLEDPDREPAALVERAHRQMSRTRGGALGVAQITSGNNGSGGSVVFAGLGNITATLLSPGQRKNMLSVPGIAGHQARAIRQFQYDLPAGASAVLHSDGISGRWNAGALAGLSGRDPLVIAAAILAEAGMHRDDAGILVLKP